MFFFYNICIQPQRYFQNQLLMNDTFVYRLSFFKNDEIDEGYKASVMLKTVLYVAINPLLKIRIIIKKQFSVWSHFKENSLVCNFLTNIHMYKLKICICCIVIRK